MLAVIPQGTTGTVIATEIIDNGTYPLALPLSVVWAGAMIKCGGADFDGTGDVNLADMAILASQWLSVPAVPSADIAPAAGDNMVDFQDLFILIENWLQTGCN